MERYEEAFLNNEVDDDVLPKLTSDDLKEIGVTIVGHRRKLLDAIGALNASIVQEEIPADSSSARAERRQLTVMFCDLVDSTALSQKIDAEDLHEILRIYRDHCTNAIARNGGLVAKFVGDGVLAYFGYPHGHENDAERAAISGLDIANSIGQLSQSLKYDLPKPLAVRIGIASGPVVVGDIRGEVSRESDAVIGETPNLAARLQAQAPPNAVVVAETTKQLVARLFRFENLGRRPLKGIAEPQQVWQVLSEDTIESRFRALHRQSLTPLVGREFEEDVLLRRWNRAAVGDGQVVLVTGEPGIGKSRLCEALRARVVDRQHSVLTFQCSPLQTGSALYPVARHMEFAAGIEPEHGADDRYKHLKGLLERSNALLPEYLDPLAGLLSIPSEPGHTPPNPDPQQQKTQVHHILLQYLTSVETLDPALVIFEDVHWADASSMELLNRFVEKVASVPILALITSRNEFDSAWIDQSHVALLTLDRLPNRESRAIIEWLTRSAPLTHSILDEVIARTDGVPLFIEETVHSVLDRQLRGALLSDVHELQTVPVTLQDSFMSRLDGLNFGKQVAQHGAAIGREFSLDLLEMASDLDAPTISLGLEELIAAEIVLRRGDKADPLFAFKHALLQEAAYNSMLLKDRRNFHKRLAERSGNAFANEPATLAHHWEQAGVFEKAVDLRVLAGERAAEQWATWEAVAQYRQALRLLDRIDDTHQLERRYLDLCVGVTLLGHSFETDADRSEFMRQLDRAIAIATNLNDLASLARLEAFKGEGVYDVEPMARAAAYASELGDPRTEAEVARRYAYLLGNFGRFEEALLHVERSLDLFGELDDLVEQGVAMGGAGRCYSSRAGQLERAFRYAEEARRITEETGDEKVRYWLAMEIEPCMYQGDWKRALAIAERDLKWTWELGYWSVYLFSSAWTAICCLKLDHDKKARALLDKAETAARRADDIHAKIFPKIALARYHLYHSESEAAIAAAKDGLGLAERISSALEIGAARRALGEAYWGLSRNEEAEAQLRQSVEILEGIQSKPELAQSLLAYGRFKRAQDSDEGEQLLARALTHFEDINATGWIAEARQSLSE